MALSATAAPRPPWRPSILDGYILRMLALPALAVLGVTLVAFLLEQTLRLIDQLAANGAHMGYLVGLVGNMIPYQLGLALPAAFFVAMFMVIGRLGEESQIDAFLAGGVSFDRLLAPLVFAGLLLGVLNLLLMGYLQPYSRFGYRAVLNAATEAGWTARLDPQVFINAGPQFTISADEADPTGRELTGVFISRKSDGGEQVVTATRGVLGLARDQKTTELRLEGGLILSQAGETPRLLRFGRLTDRELIKGGAALRPRGGNEQELTFPELVSEAQRPDALIPRRVLEAELLARLARSLAIPLLPFIALPLAMASKRGSRTAGMIVGAVILVAYHHSVTLAKSFSDEGVISPFLSIGAVFLAITVFSLWLFFSSRTRPGDTPLSSLLRAIDALIERRPKTAAKASAKVAAKGPLSLSAYLTRMMAVRTLGAGVALIALLQLIDLLGETSQILEHGGVLDIGRYMLLRAPSMVQEVAPFAVLAGAVFTFSQLARNSELVVMRICGMSLFEILRRTLPVALAVAVVDMAVTDQVAPRAEEALATWWKATTPGAHADPGAPRWFRIEDNIVKVASASADGRRIDGLTVYERDAQHSLVRRLQAHEADWTPGQGWVLRDAEITDVGPVRATGMTVAAADWRTSLRPGDVARVFNAANPFSSGYEITSWTALRSLFGKGAIDKPPSEFETKLYRTLAEGMAPLIMLLLALPTALGHARSNRTGPIIFGLGCGLLYLVVDGILTSMGSTGVIPPGIAAWGAPIAFAAGAVSLLLYAEG